MATASSDCTLSAANDARGRDEWTAAPGAAGTRCWLPPPSRRRHLAGPSTSGAPGASPSPHGRLLGAATGPLFAGRLLLLLFRFVRKEPDTSEPAGSGCYTATAATAAAEDPGMSTKLLRQVFGAEA